MYILCSAPSTNKLLSSAAAFKMSPLAAPTSILKQFFVRVKSHISRSPRSLASSSSTKDPNVIGNLKTIQRKTETQVQNRLP